MKFFMFLKAEERSGHTATCNLLLLWQEPLRVLGQGLLLTFSLLLLSQQIRYWCQVWCVSKQKVYWKESYCVCFFRDSYS